MPNKKPKPATSKPKKMTPNRRGAEGPKNRPAAKPRSAKSISGDYRGSKQPRRKPVKTASGFHKALKGSQYGTKAWN